LPLLLEKTNRTVRPLGNLGVGDIVVGISGARRSPAAAIAVGGRLLGFCEEERITRVRGAGLRPGELPNDSVSAVLRLAGSSSEKVSAWVTGEEGVVLPAGLPRLRLDHHHCHAATAFLTSPFQDAAVIVCDRNTAPEVSVWRGHDGELVNEQWPWVGPGFASLFTQCSEIFGFSAGHEHRFEALARLGGDTDPDRISRLFAYVDGTLRVDPDWQRAIVTWLNEGGIPWSLENRARVAGAFQRSLGNVLVEFAENVRSQLGAERLCLGGGLFYNTYFNTVLAHSSFVDVFVAPNPGNAGIASGAALAVGQRRAQHNEASPFLGPGFELEEIKQTLDNCKLSYECLSEGQIVDGCVRDLMAGRLVGWFQGRMEWAHRALGNRSILANPLSPYVLDNLNVFLKQRERYRAYGLSVCEEEAGDYFIGPTRSAWMEYEYELKAPDRLRHAVPMGARTLRVQTVNPEPSLFRSLHRAFADASGTGVLVNTSFNGFSEPIVSSPRDAIRVFYGTGLDVLILGRFVIRK
jgi:carbamoyltransferase